MKFSNKLMSVDNLGVAIAWTIRTGQKSGFYEEKIVSKLSVSKRIWKISALQTWDFLKMVRHLLIRASIPIAELSGQSVKSFGSKKKAFLLYNEWLNKIKTSGGWPTFCCVIHIWFGAVIFWCRVCKFLNKHYIHRL